MAQGDPARNAVVLLSGGLDSATCLAVAKGDGFACYAISFDYSQRHRHELEAADAVARSMGVTDHRTISIDLRAFGGSALTSDIPVPKDQESWDPGCVPVTYVPARNLIFLSMAAAFAETIGASDIFIGVNAVDYSGYPDCRPEFIRSFEQTVRLGTKAGVEGRRFSIQTPLIQLTKAQIIQLGTRLGVDYALTHSCYDPVGGLACGQCESCRIRRRGFEQAGIKDPTRYA